MNASGWQTAPLQTMWFEVVTVTKSACRQLLEGFSGVSDLYRPILTAFREKAAGRVVYPYLIVYSSLHLFLNPVRPSVSCT